MKALIFIGILLQKESCMSEIMRSFAGFCVIDNTRGLFNWCVQGFFCLSLLHGLSIPVFTWLLNDFCDIFINYFFLL